MKKRSRIALIFVTAFILIILQIILMKNLIAEEINDLHSLADKGVIHLKSSIIDNNELVLLNGEWEFYPGEYLYSEDFEKGIAEDIHYTKLPGSWNGYETDRPKQSEYEYGTYRLNVYTDREELKLAMNIAATDIDAYKLFVDGKKVLSVGTLGTDRQNTIPERKKAAAEIVIDEKAEVIIHASNFNYNPGGFQVPIIIGSEKAVNELTVFNLGKDNFALGMFSVLAAYYFFIWRGSKEYNKTPLYFMLVSILAIFYTITNNEVIIKQLIWNIPYKVQIIMSYMLSIGGTTLYIFLLHDLYERETIGYVKLFSIARCLIMTAGAACLPIDFILNIGMFNHYIALIEFAYGIYVLSRVIVNGDKDAYVILLGTIVIVATIVFDVICFTSGIISVFGIFTPLGLVVFILCFAVIVAKMYENSFKEMKRLSTRLMQIDKIKDEFLTNTSHELRTPINSIIAITESVIDGAEGEVNNQQKKSLSMVVNSGRRLSNLINDILDYSRIKSGEIHLMKSTFRIEELVDNVMKEFEYLAADNNIRLKTEIMERLSPVYADKYRIIQVIYNLIGNAVKFTPLGGEVTTVIYEEEKNIYVSVNDTGIGISEDKLEIIFKSFEQADSSIIRKYGGMGLGLSISKQIIEAHEGKISVYSKLNVGTKFIFNIPLSDIKDEAEPLQDFDQQIGEMTLEKADRLVIYGIKKETIIIIDDNYSNIVGVAGIIKTLGYSIKGFTRAEEGLKEILENEYAEMAVVDLMMPKLSGYEICNKVRSVYSLLDFPILILTARTQLESIVESFNAGANDFLHKPFEAEELKARVGTLCNLKSSTDIARELTKKNMQLKKANDEIRELVNTDFLTGVLNRRCFYERLGELIISEDKNTYSSIGIISIDIDFFKRVNDTYGHDMGDRVLVEFTAMLEKNTRKIDLVARLGGEEFIVSAIDKNSDNIISIAQQLRGKCEEIDIEGFNEKITASFGVTILKDEDTVDSVIKRADEALYEAKHSGRNTVKFKE